MSELGPVSSMWNRLRRYDGVPQWWCEVFVSLGLTEEEAETYVITASKDKDSPLAKANEASLNATLRSYASARGIELLGAGTEFSGEGRLVSKLVHTVTTVCSPAEQDAIIRLVGEYADVRFKERIDGVYTQHAVANGVRSVNQAFARKSTPRGARVLEVGPSVRSMVTAGVDPEFNHGCCPVLDLRDAGRYSIDSWLQRVADGDAGMRPSCVKAAQAAVDPAAGYICRSRVQECTYNCEYIISNESTHDISFDDLPNIMARHGARYWIGFQTRATGLVKGGHIRQGLNADMATRWRISDDGKSINFHFERSASFSYTHGLEQWFRYEERLNYRWRGAYHDYVYTQLPITTSAVLAFVVVRVPRTTHSLREPAYMSSGLAGYVRLRSIRAVGGCMGSATPSFEPYEFYMERLAFDKVLEHRLTLGVKATIATTISYMRSVRVRFYINGQALGIDQAISVDIMESAAVLVEVLAADYRKSMDRDFAVLMDVAGRAAVSKESGFFPAVASWFATYSRAFGRMSEKLRGILLQWLEDSDFEFSADPCEEYVRLDNAGLGEVTEEQRLESPGCGCRDLVDVRAALAYADDLSKHERAELQAYAEELVEKSKSCSCILQDLDEEFDADDDFVDARSEVCESEVEEPSRGCSDSGFCSMDKESVEQELVTPPLHVAVREYATWADFMDKSARSEAKLDSSVLFLNGDPTEADVARMGTQRTKHAVVVIVNGEIRDVIGTISEENTFSEVYVRSLGRTCKVHRIGLRRYIKESVTELCYTSSALRIMNGQDLARAALDTLSDIPPTYKMPRYLFNNAVPGGGKTTQAIKKIREATARGELVLYLAETVASTDKVWKEAYDADPTKARLCRTFDSYLMHGLELPEEATVSLLLLDEVPMAHAGKVFATILKVKPVDVIMYGDFKQITFVPFTSSMKIKYASLERYVKVVTWNETHRFGERTCAMWLDVYGTIYPCTCHEHDDLGIEYVKIRGASEVPRNFAPGTRVLTYTQEEKTVVKRELGFEGSLEKLRHNQHLGLSTVHEDQGGTHDVVLVVRTANKKNLKESRFSPSIYNRLPWALVAGTRHVSRLVYYSAGDEDMLAKRIKLANDPARLRAVRQRLHWDDVKADAMPAPSFGI